MDEPNVGLFVTIFPEKKGDYLEKFAFVWWLKSKNPKFSNRYDGISQKWSIDDLYSPKGKR